MLGGGGVRPNGSRCMAGCTSTRNRLYVYIWPDLRKPVIDLPPARDRSR